jgi:fermentation-respiration switch protein FrsA (DUF1100 family)
MLYYPTRVKYVDPSKLKYTPKEIVVNSEQGEKWVGWYFTRGKSSAPGAANRPTLLFFHGNGQNLSAHFFGLYWILDEGYDFLIFDYPGYGGSEGQPTPDNTVTSGQAFFQWLRDNRVSKGPIAIFGQSLGGAVAMTVAKDLSRDPDLCLVIVDSTFASYRGAARSLLSAHWTTWSLQWIPYLVISDSAAPKADIAQISPKPLIVTHGRRDRIVAFELGEDVFAKAQEPKEFWPVDEGEHIQSFQHPAEGPSLRKKLVEALSNSCESKGKAEI